MASYSEFLKLLQEIPRAGKAPTPSHLPPKETFEQLCFDFPQLSVDDLFAFKNDFVKSVEDEKYGVFPISNRFINGIAYGASKYGINNNNANNDTKEKLEISPFFEQYSTINAVALIKLVRNALRTTQPEILDEMLLEYILETDPYETIQEDDTDAVIASLTPNNKKEPESLEHVVAHEQDGDNEVYEPYSHSAPVEFKFAEAPTEVRGDWQHLSKKLTQLCSHVAYDKLSHETTWSDLDLFADVVEIVRSIRSHSYLSLENQVPRFVFLLRDRMLDKPTLLVRSVLQFCIDILELNATTVQHSDAQMGVSIFASLVTQKLTNSVADVFDEIISKNIKFFEQRTASISELNQQSASNVEKELIENGLVRDLVSLFIKFGLQDDMTDTRHFVSFLCIHFEKISQYVQQVPSLTELLLSEEFQKSYPEEVIILAHSFFIHPLPEESPINWLELAEKLAAEIFPTSGNNGEWLLDSAIVHQLHMLLTLSLPLREVAGPPRVVTSINSIFAGGFLGSMMRKFQSEVEVLYKATIIVSKEDTSTEGKRKRKIMKKQHTLLGKLQSLLKSLLGEQSKKD